MRSFQSLSEQEILALAISLEEEDARIYGDFADGLMADYPATAAILNEMRGEEDGHRHRLIGLLRSDRDLARSSEIAAASGATGGCWGRSCGF